ncbi:hypothetical protein V2W45_1237519, partial [Cenococcum geophilum]
YDGFTTAILAALENAIKIGEEMGLAVKTAYKKAVVAVNKVKEWAEVHPEMTAVIITLITLGVLALIIPWLMAYLGFAKEGIIKGKFVTCFYTIYRGFILKGLLFLYLQSLSTKIGRNWRG